MNRRTIDALVRRQLAVTALGLALVLLVWAFVRTQGVDVHATVDGYVRAHHPPRPASLRLAWLQLLATGAVAVVVLGHAAAVAAYVFRKEGSH